MLQTAYIYGLILTVYEMSRYGVCIGTCVRQKKNKRQRGRVNRMHTMVLTRDFYFLIYNFLFKLFCNDHVLLL